MKTSLKLITCGTSTLFAAVLALQAQSSTPTQPRDPQLPPSPSGTVAPGSSATGSATGGDTSWRSMQSEQEKEKEKNKNRSTSGSATGSADTSTRGSISATSSDRPASGSSSSTSATTGTSGATSQVGTQANTSQTRTSTQNTVVSAQTDAQVTTVVQQIDAQGPVVVERISTRFVDSACNEENARALVEALHSGGSVTLRGNDGKTATFNVSQKLGYGDAFIALSLAEEALRQAGITGCATPEQWQAVLVGGELKGGTITSSTTTTTERFPGVLVLRQQHGGWGQVAQTTNVQLGTVVANAQTSLNIDAPTSDLPPRSGFGDEADKNAKASPRGQEKGQMKGYDADKERREREKLRNDSVMPRDGTSSSDTEDPSGKRDSKGQPDQPPRGY